jgi:hypothetical protein
MSSSTVIIFGTFSAILLIMSCISLNASQYYSELGFDESHHLLTKPTIVLRDRTSLTLSKEIK